MRYGFGQKLYQVQQEVGRSKPRTERCAEQLVNPTAKAFDFDIVVNTDQQYANRQSQSRIQVSCRHDAQQSMMITGNALPCHRQQINWQHIHGVHQENPDKQGQTQWGNGFTRLFVMDNALTHVIHEFEQNFNSRLETTGNTGRRFFGTAPQKKAADYAQ